MLSKTLIQQLKLYNVNIQCTHKITPIYRTQHVPSSHPTLKMVKMSLYLWEMFPLSCSDAYEHVKKRIVCNRKLCLLSVWISLLHIPFLEIDHIFSLSCFLKKVLSQLQMYWNVHSFWGTTSTWVMYAVSKVICMTIYIVDSKWRHQNYDWTHMELYSKKNKQTCETTCFWEHCLSYFYLDTWKPNTTCLNWVCNTLLCSYRCCLYIRCQLQLSTATIYICILSFQKCYSCCAGSFPY